MSIESRVLREALVQTFAKRKMADVNLQDLPTQFPEMPSTWQSAFDKQVEVSSLPWKTSAIAHAVAARFLRTLEVGADVLLREATVSDVERVLVYGGPDSQRRSTARVLSWRDVGDYDWIGAG